MRLDSVEIVGFKSFCDRQEISFRGGVTGIVGPNGCGKSNISDAINWVLGEQSAKSLRGTSMEDVIFNGSSSRQPLQMAEVNLRVSGLNGNSPDGSPECVVTRRLYRNGESEYLMNGHACRLRDIHELFMDTGLGSKAYSIIEQGKIGQILSSKPADRRTIIEEAAGITKYRARRRQTQLKLEAAQQNLLRVNDIVNEVEKQLESLKRQAAKARRWRVVREEMQGVERVLFGRRFLELGERSRLLEERHDAEAGRERAATIALESEEARLEVLRQGLYDRETSLEEARGRRSEVTLAVDRHQGRCGYCKQQLAEDEGRAALAAREEQELVSRVAPLTEALAGRRVAEARLHGELDAAEGELGSADAAVALAAARQAQAEADQESGREAQVGLLGRIAALQNSRASVTGNAERAAAVLLKLAAEIDDLGREEARVGGVRDAARARGREAETLVAELEEARRAAAAREDESRGRAESLGREADAVQSERDGLAGRRASLEEMVATHSAFDEGVRALLGRPEGLEVFGVLADALEADSEHERAVEAFLGERLQAVIVSDAEQARRGIRWLRSSGAGRGAFLPLASARTQNDCGPLREIAAQEEKALGLLSDFYRVSGPHADRIRASLPDAVVVATLEDALALASRQGPVCVVTLEGETLRGALVEGGRDVKGLLAPRREVKEVAARQEEAEARLAALRAAAAEAHALAAAAAAEARSLEERIHAAEKDLVAVRHEIHTAEDEAGRLFRKGRVLDAERAQAEEERRAAEVRLADIEQALEAAETEHEEGHRRLAEMAATVAGARAAAEAAQARHAEARSSLAALRERTAAAENERRRSEEDLAELEQRIAGARAHAAETAARRGELAAEIAEVERLLAEALRQRDRAVGEAAAAEERVREARAEIEGREQGLKERRRERDVLRDALSEVDVERARTGSDLDHLARECQQSVGVAAAEAAAALSDEDRARDVDALAAQVQELREKLERMGQVNVLAVEQAQELDERHAFLTAQRQDLLDSIAELDHAIRKIDRASRERFQEAFQIINQHFGEVFRQLFGGGTAGLSLLDEEDLLESGIDIMAQPPGKRLQNVLLLSGGEKALTAIALLFAIFQYKPSPFCILDEVDAPLDDANIGRFVGMLQGLKDETQFVLITHSRKTMSIADQLYGVTMEEPGVSKLVSVRFT
ncbi:MAG TPA: chromosome segregation protein SMC [Vicinamibacteria bacterium]|nr:chromosome segregation protein SMC [Vicinamibacteria bacterium]